MIGRPLRMVSRAHLGFLDEPIRLQMEIDRLSLACDLKNKWGCPTYFSSSTALAIRKPRPMGDDRPSLVGDPGLGSITRGAFAHGEIRQHSLIAHVHPLVIKEFHGLLL
jgi:hypothetical protein